MMQRIDISPFDDYETPSVPAGHVRRGLIGGRRWLAVVPTLWVSSLALIASTFIPGVELALGKLPGDLVLGAAESPVYLPLATSALVTAAVSGLFYLASNHLTRR